MQAIQINRSIKTQQQGPRGTSLTMYSLPPTKEISLEDFERCAFDRLQVLKTIENLKNSGYSVHSQEYKDRLQAKIDKYLPLSLYSTASSSSSSSKQDAVYIQRIKDVMSHHVLRLAYCRTEELRRWFLTQECALFKYRFDNARSNQVELFLEENDLEYPSIPRDEYEMIETDLQSVHANDFWKKEQETEYFKVPFEEAIALVSNRRVYLRNGMAYVPRSELSTIVSGQFRSHLSAALATTSRSLPRVHLDERLRPVLLNLSKQHLQTDYKGKTTGSVSIDQLDALASSSFPLCMKAMHQGLKKDHHLKHDGRLQYGLFLKGIGLSLDDALTFWRSEFTKKMPLDKFNRSYAYGVRYNYGQEGKRVDWSPHSCRKIITGSQAGHGSHHGCPFRNWNESHLRSELSGKGASREQTNELIMLVSKQHYQIACRRYFELTHPGVDASEVGNHPNAYFDASFEALKKALGTTEKQSSSSSSSSSTETSKGKEPVLVKSSDDVMNTEEQVEENKQEVKMEEKMEVEAQ